MAKVKRSSPFAAPAPLASRPGATAAKAKKPAAAAAAAGAAITPGKSPAPPSPLVVIEIPSSPDRSTGGGGGRSTKKARKMPAPRTLDLDDEVEMWTPRQKQRLDEDCQILAGDPLASTTEVAPSPAAAANDEIAVVAERGKIACRDYPHPRSACAKNPFSRTPHEHYCDKCFCYVCDVAAPCVSWKGQSGHCHASDRDKHWKNMRISRQKATKAKPS